MADLIITDDNWQSVCFSPTTDHLCGTLPRDFSAVPLGSLPFASAFGNQIATIPMEEWPDRIADLERAKATLEDIWRDTEIGIWNQGSLPFCHGFSAVHAVAVMRASQGLPYVSLSASSVAAPVTGYRPAGAYIHDDLKQMVDVGVASTKFVPMATYRRGDFRDGWDTDAARNRVVEWWDVEPRNVLLAGSLVLQGMPCCVGLNWWGHAVNFYRLRDLDKSKPATDWRRYGFRGPNSWGLSWGDQGWFTLTGTKMLADAIYVPRVIAVG